MNALEYREKLKDPRWQKVRFAIFNRDNWKCIRCGASERPLHTHHLSYTAYDPWDEPLENLATLCEDCHSLEHGIDAENGTPIEDLATLPSSAKWIKATIIEGVEAIAKRFQTPGSLTGISTGFKEFDKMTDGLHGGEMIVIAARPSMGKTALTLNIADNIAVGLGIPVAIYSLEMDNLQVVQRLLLSRSRVNLQRVRDGYMREQDFPQIVSAAESIAKAPLLIDDASGITVQELASRIKYSVQKFGVRLAIIDYLQLLRSTSRRSRDSRQVEIAEISVGIKTMAKEFNIPIIALSQLNRNTESRGGDNWGRPRLSDLRESGSIEQDADIVALLVRHEYYADTEEERRLSEGQATLIIAKQRNGPVGDVGLTFFKDFARFEDRIVVA
jgi:replicative DNA helicase